jgi:hypothetical protein
MKIYDFETFKKNCKNIKAIKYKNLEDITKSCYNKEYFAWGRKFEASFVLMNVTYYPSWTTIELNIFCEENKKVIKTHLDEIGFKDYVEYVETENTELEIE